MYLLEAVSKSCIQFCAFTHYPQVEFCKEGLLMQSEKSASLRLIRYEAKTQ